MFAKRSAFHCLVVVASLVGCTNVDVGSLPEPPADGTGAGMDGDGDSPGTGAVMTGTGAVMTGTGAMDMAAGGTPRPGDSPDAGNPDCEPNPDDADCPEVCPEVCNGDDDDCDGAVDEAGAADQCMLPNASATCLSARCVVADCGDGYADCDGDDGNGCETALGTLDDCGGCGDACSFDRATAVCNVGVCEPSGCIDDFGDCDDTPEDCETELNSVLNCGACGKLCGFVDRASSTCLDGACAVEECVGNFGDCNATFEDGCELELNEDENCGGCGVACELAGSVTECSSGVCTATDCGPDYDECDGDRQNGCESLFEDDNCGACGQVCTTEALDHVEGAGCDAGNCIVVCSDLFGDCDGQPNGCETPLNTSGNCGACGIACNPENATGDCSEGSCGIGACAEGWEDCDGDPDNGCETNLADPATCGSCDQQCPDRIGCVDGVCTGITCDPGEADCDGNDTCESVLSTDATCGACNVACEFNEGVEAHGGVACAADGGQLGYACELTCEDGYDDCDDDFRNGCETDLRTVDDCGACGQVCAKQHATPSCGSGVCEVGTCDDDWGDCDGDRLSCESKLDSIANCGACNVGCEFDNAVGACVGAVGARSCEVASCSPVDFADCDGTVGNGCEIDTTSDADNCGSCGMDCDGLPNVAVPECQQSACVPDTCLGGYDDCTADPGCETDTTEVANCGGCGNDCDALLDNTASTTCGAGETCGIGTCASGFDSCDGQDANGCETDIAGDAGNCGGCASAGANDACVGLPNVGNSSCNSGDCVINACSGSFLNCNGDTADGCEANVDNDGQNCGGCGNDCTDLPHVTGASCNAQTCGALVCDDGFADCNKVVEDGCETDLTLPATCGGCNTDCDAILPNTASTTCGVSRTCGVGSCDDGFADCDGMAGNGCEQNTASDVDNCGGCGNLNENTQCTGLTGVTTSICSGGTCIVTACDMGLEDCNQLATDGCEWDPMKDGTCCDAQNDADNDGTDDCADGCVNDPGKQDPGVCGCGVPDTDSDSDGYANCIDGCKNDGNKQDPGVCGCGVADADDDGDGFLNCLELCDDDVNKQDPGACGCGVADTDSDGDGFEDCNEFCDADPNKQDAGACGCGVSDVDSDGDGFEDCNEVCDADGLKQDPGVCGCGVPDEDSDGDGTLDCDDGCPFDPELLVAGDCGCPSTPEAAGTLCGDGLCDDNTQCDGDGSCGSRFECVPHKKIASGGDSACGLDSSGRVICWGDGGVGQLGFGRTVDYRRAGTFVANIDDAVEVDFGKDGNHACALRASGEIECWGEGANGRLGYGDTANRSAPVTVSGITTAIQVTTGNDFGCALLESGEVRCWGEGYAGRLGYGGTANSNTPVAVVAGETGSGNLKRVLQIASGEQHTCAKLESGRAVCWGEGASGRLGDGGAGNEETPVYVHGVGDPGSCDGGNQSGCLADVEMLAAGENVTLAIHGGGLVSSWGADSYNESGADAGTHYYPLRVQGLGGTDTLDDAIWVGMGRDHGCAVRQGGQAVCWGEDDYGRLGDADLGGANPDHAVAVVGAQDYDQISPGTLFSCAHTVGGHVRCFGDNGQGNLATGTSTDHDEPQEMAGTQDAFVQADVLAFGCAVTDVGEVYCWGRQAAGELGNPAIGPGTDVWAPTKVVNIDDAIDVTVGEYFACALTSAGKVRCWGDNPYNQLGIGPTTADQYSPVTVLASQGVELDGVVQIAGGWWHACALRDDGTVWCWGNGGYGSLGNGSTANSGYPVQVHGVGNSGLLGGVDAIGAGRAHTCATQGDSPNRTMVCWGYNGGGQLGDGTLGNRSAPVAVGGGETGFSGAWDSISGGQYNSCALKESGEAYCWGYDVYGRIGDGSAGGYEYTATKVAGGFDDFVAINTDGENLSSACAVRAGGAVYCWGYNNYGVRGDEGTGGTVATPSRVHMAEAAADQGNPDLLSPVLNVGGGYFTKNAVHADGSVSSWGYNGWGQLGTGHTGDWSQPVRLGVPVR